MKLSSIKKSMTVFVATLLLAVALISVIAGQASAIQIPYEDIGSVSLKTPVFNTYTNVPNGVGNEADFVRIRPSTGDVADNGAGGVRNALYVNGQADDCQVGEKFDIRTYVHNGADDEYNNNGSGTSVAHGTEARMVAPFSTPGKTLTFTSTIRATDVSPVTDTARLYCSSTEDVMLKLVPSSVKVYSSQYGFKNVADSAVNGVLPIGSRVAGSGDVWGCWADRVMIAYIVEVVEIEKVEPIYTCDLLTATFISDKKYKFTTKATAQNGATITGYEYNFGDGSDTLTTAESTVTKTFAKDGKYEVIVNVIFSVNGVSKKVTSTNCMVKVTASSTPMCTIAGKEHLPANSPDCSEVKGVVTTIPNTGAGSTMAIIFAVTAAAGTFLHRKFTLNR